LAIADAEDGRPSGKNFGVYRGASGFINASGAAGDDDSPAAPQFSCRRFARQDIGVDAQLTNLPSNEMCILAARVEDGHLRVRYVIGHRYL
jgi:hypothetical protein